jgi:hypothetical protein
VHPQKQSMAKQIKTKQSKENTTYSPHVRDVGSGFAIVWGFRSQSHESDHRRVCLHPSTRLFCFVGCGTRCETNGNPLRHKRDREVVVATLDNDVMCELMCFAHLQHLVPFLMDAK